MTWTHLRGVRIVGYSVGIQGYFGGSSQRQSNSSFNVPTEEALQKIKVDLAK